MSPRSPSRVRWNADQYDAKHTYVPRYGADVLKLLAPGKGERILDLGCGTGHLTAQIAASGARVVGLDAAPQMIEKAREAYPGLEFVVADAVTFAFDEPFDAVFSNAAIHWISADAQGLVVKNITGALKPGGRFVAEFGGKGNVQMLVNAMRAALSELGVASAGSPSPWFFPSIGEYASIVEQHGLETLSAELFDRATPLDAGEDGIREWIAMFGADFAGHVPPDRYDAFVHAVERRLRGTLYRDGTWYADYRRLRIIARRPGAGS
jgi:trans-aconitate methyltransferase